MAEQFEEQDLEAPVAYNADEYEEITSDEVDRVIAAIEELMQSISSENIRAHLSAAADEIFSLVYDEMGEGFEPADDVQTEAA